MMKGLFLGLLVGSLPNWLPSLVMAGGEGEGKQCVIVTKVEVKTDGDGTYEDGDAHKVFVVVDAGGAVDLAGADGQDVRVFVTAMAGDAGDVKIQRIRLRGIGEHDPDRGWLGISIGLVTDTLAAHVDVQDQGVVVLNVVEGSPAEDAGITVHDIILSLNGEEIEGEDVDQRVPRLVKRNGAHKPGEAGEMGNIGGGDKSPMPGGRGPRGRPRHDPAP